MGKGVEESIMTLFKESELKKIRNKLAVESGGDIPDEDWNKIVRDIEEKNRELIKKELPKGFWFALFNIAENSDCIIKIDHENLGEKLRYFRKLPHWLVQKKIYFGW